MAKKIKHTGGYLCGAVRYSLDVDPIATAACHCRDCQKSTGSAYALLLVIPTESMVLEGKFNAWAVRGDSGGTNTRKSCAACGSLISEETNGLKGFRLVLAGSLDDPSWVQPDFHCWVSSKQPWLKLDDGLPAFEKGPDPARLTAGKSRPM